MQSNIVTRSKTLLMSRRAYQPDPAAEFLKANPNLGKKLFDFLDSQDVQKKRVIQKHKKTKTDSDLPSIFQSVLITGPFQEMKTFTQCSRWDALDQHHENLESWDKLSDADKIRAYNVDCLPLLRYLATTPILTGVLEQDDSDADDEDLDVPRERINLTALMCAAYHLQTDRLSE